MLLLPSLSAQAASAIGSNRIAAIFVDVPKRNSSTCPRDCLKPPRAELEFASGLSAGRPVRAEQKQYRPAVTGEAVTDGPGLVPAGAAGQFGSNHAGGSVSAALGGGRNVLGHNLRRRVGLVRSHVLVVAMMGIVLVMMAAHPGIRVQQLRFRLVGLDDRRGGRLGDRRLGRFRDRRRGCLVCGSGKRGSRDNGNG